MLRSSVEARLWQQERMLSPWLLVLDVESVVIIGAIALRMLDKGMEVHEVECM